jgi:hypothetical protein
MEEIVNIISKLLTSAFILILFTGCGGVKMNNAKSVAGGFSKSVLEGNLLKAKKLSVLSDDEINKLISKIKGKYKDFSVEQFLINGIFIEKARFIPNNIDAAELKVSFSMELKTNKEYAVAKIAFEKSNSKEEAVKKFSDAIIKNSISSVSDIVENSGELVKTAAALKGASKYTILQLSADDPSVMVEFTLGSSSKILSFKVKKSGNKFLIYEMKFE